MNATEAEPLTATLEDFPVNHDGSSAFTFRITFSANVDITPNDMRDHALTVSGADGDEREPRGRTFRSVGTDAGAGRDGSGGDSGAAEPRLHGDGRACVRRTAKRCRRGWGHSVPGPAPSPQGQQALAPLAASFVSVPAEHDGETAFLAGARLRRGGGAELEGEHPGAARSDRGFGDERCAARTGGSTIGGSGFSHPRTRR